VASGACEAGVSGALALTTSFRPATAGFSSMVCTWYSPSDGSARSTRSPTKTLDLDHFKRINDEHGHDAGDRVLQEFAHRIRGRVRSRDVVARTGGEEVVVLVPDAGAEASAVVARRMWEAVRAAPFDVGAAQVTVTVSVGCATGEASAKLLAEARRLRYEAKEAGRDRIQSGSTPGTTAT
jgi:two-component system cell cycle response regulator